MPYVIVEKWNTGVGHKKGQPKPRIDGPFYYVGGGAQRFYLRSTRDINKAARFQTIEGAKERAASAYVSYNVDPDRYDFVWVD